MVEINKKKNERIYLEKIQMLLKESSKKNFINNLKDNNEYKALFNYFEKLAKEGDPQAQFALGCCYEIGKGVEKNIQEAILWHRRAAEQGHNQAKEQLKKLEENQKGL